MTKERKEIVERLREEGRQAGLAGRHWQTNPYGKTCNPDYLRWAEGWDVGEAERLLNSCDEDLPILDPHGDSRWGDE